MLKIRSLQPLNANLATLTPIFWQFAKENQDKQSKTAQQIMRQDQNWIANLLNRDQ